MVNSVMSKITSNKSQKEAFLFYLKKMDIAMLDIVLPDNIQYFGANKADFLDRINYMVNQFRLAGEATGSMSLSPPSFSLHLHGSSYDPTKRGDSFAETDVSNPFYVPSQLPPATYRGRAATGIQNSEKAQDRATRVRMLGQ